MKGPASSRHSGWAATQGQRGCRPTGGGPCFRRTLSIITCHANLGKGFELSAEAGGGGQGEGCLRRAVRYALGQAFLFWP